MMGRNNFPVDNIDILSQVNNSSRFVDPDKTGLNFLIDEIRTIAESVFAHNGNTQENSRSSIKNIFIEYCSIGVMLSDSKMIGFAALDKRNDINFNLNVKKHAFNIIGAIVPYGLSLFVHPDFVSRTAILNSEIGAYHSSYIEDCTIEDIATRLKIDLNKLNCEIEKVLTKGNNTSEVTKDELYWSGTYDWTYEKLINSIDTFQKKYQELPPIQDLFTLFKHYYDIAFGQNEQNAENSCYIGVPLLGAQVGEMPISGQGAAFIYFTYDRDVPRDKIRDFVSQLSPRIDYILKAYLFNLLAFSALSLKEQAKKEAVKSAKAAIMSRNMSHNIGSHVMSYLKQHLGSVKDIVADGILSDLINGENELAKKLENTTENTTLPFLMGLGHFISYIQERQDFIATIATDYIPYFGNANFKDTIYDELNPDKRAERHTERTNGKTDNILLGNIARSEGLGRNNQSTSRRSGLLADIVLNFQDSYNNVFDGNPVVNKDNPIAGRENAKKALEAMRKWEISIPGGVIGRQAFFSIVENLIRNTAKHGNWRDQGKLELTFNYYTKDSLTEEFCSLKEREADILRRNTDKDGKLKKLSKEDEDKLNDIRRNLEKWNEDAALTEKPHFWGEDKKKHNSLMEVLWYFYGQSLDADDLFFVTITDNVNISEKAVNKLRVALVEDYIDNESKMIEGNKGIKEIRISAAWLRGAKNEEEYYNSGAKLIDPQTWKKAPLVYVRQHSGCLQYIICLQKPRKLAVVSWRLFSEESEKAFKKLNCRYYTPETYREEKNKSFDFILFDDCDKSENEEYSYDALKPISSSRFWKLSDIEELAKKDNKEEPELFKKLQNVTEESLDDILLLLYKKLSHYEAEDSIWIDDKTAAANVGRDVDGMTPKYIKSDKITIRDGISKGVHKYIYRTHHDSEKEYNNYIDKVNKGTIEGNIFVEGISGNNSTDRLVRNEKLNDVWFYKHLHAMKEQVAVFDERLFTKIFGLEESHLKDEGTFKIDDSNRDLYRERYYEEIINSDDVLYSSFVDDNTPEEQDRILWEKFKNETSPTTSKENANALTGFKPIVYKQKNVYVFTLIQDPNPDKQNMFNLYGLSKESNITKAICTKIASLSWSQTDGLKFEGEITKKGDDYINNYKRFDRMSIHQGLLDKLYEVFGIKEKPHEKERLTRQFHQAFSTSFVNVTKSNDESPEKVAEKKEHQFLAGLCIHSGRSKPSQIDMPQKLPFIQYASIENAVLDCKYSLVELLDFARYE